MLVLLGNSFLNLHGLWIVFFVICRLFLGLIFFTFRSYITELYAGHQSGTFNSESSSQVRTGRRKSRNVMSAARRNSSSMQLKTQMVCKKQVLKC